METTYQIRRIANSIKRVIGAITFRGRAEEGEIGSAKGDVRCVVCARVVCVPPHPQAPAGRVKRRKWQSRRIALLISVEKAGRPFANFFSRTISRGLYDTPLSSLSLANFRPIDLSHDQNDRSSSRFATQPTCARFTYGGRFRIMAEESVPRVETSRVRCQRLRPAIKFTRTWPETIAGTIRFEGSKLHVLYLQNCIDEKEKKEKD